MKISSECRLRLAQRVRTVWLSSLCVNQNDLDERSEQAQMIGKISKRSKENLISLGEVKDE
jgi:hypothetical protein